MRPDYGAYLHTQGLSQDVPMVFYDVAVDHVSLTDAPSLTTFFHHLDGGTVYAVSFDFTDDAAVHLLARCAREIYNDLERAAESAVAAGRTVQIVPPVVVTLEAVLGPLQRSPTEDFAPMIVRRVT